MRNYAMSAGCAAYGLSGSAARRDTTVEDIGQ
jgi:hypothetical protein